MNITGHDLIMACSAIGAGLAVIAGIGPYWTGYRSRTWCSSSWTQSGCKRRYHVNHAFRTGSCRDNRSLRTLDRNALTVRTAFRLMNGAPFLE